jgi:hypothetical protein
MIAEAVLSFRKEYWTNRFPIEARFYQFGLSGPSGTLTTQRLSSPEALQAFQDELIRRESTYEWCFIAYYESMVPDQHHPG